MDRLFQLNVVLCTTNVVKGGLVSERGSFLLGRVLLLNDWLWGDLDLSCSSGRGFFEFRVELVLLI